MPETQSPVAVIGGGSIGVAFAIVFARSGRSVRLYEPESQRRAAIPDILQARLRGSRWFRPARGSTGEACRPHVADRGPRRRLWPVLPWSRNARRRISHSSSRFSPSSTGWRRPMRCWPAPPRRRCHCRPARTPSPRASPDQLARPLVGASQRGCRPSDGVARAADVGSRQIAVVIDAADVERLRAFWVAARKAWRFLGSAGPYRSAIPSEGAPGPKLIFQQVPDLARARHEEPGSTSTSPSATHSSSECARLIEPVPAD